jgi:hypothetical protein
LRLWQQDPERVTQYAIADVRETRRLAEIVAPTEFYQSQMVPDSYQNVAVTGSGENSTRSFVRAYLQRGHGVARQQAPQPYSGGYTEMRVSGVVATSSRPTSSRCTRASCSRAASPHRRIVCISFCRCSRNSPSGA